MGFLSAEQMQASPCYIEIEDGEDPLSTIQAVQFVDDKIIAQAMLSGMETPVHLECNDRQQLFDIARRILNGPLNWKRYQTQKSNGEEHPTQRQDNESTAIYAFVRTNDESGVSGIGHVADIAILENATVIRWRSATKKPSSTIFDDFDHFCSIHIDPHSTNGNHFIRYTLSEPDEFGIYFTNPSQAASAE